MMKHSLICTAVLSVLAMPAQASFSIKMANTQNLDDSRWQCKRCSMQQPHSQLSVVTSIVSSNDDHVVNRVGNEDGSSIGLGGDLHLYNNPLTLSGQANQLGFDTGYGRVEVGRENATVGLAYSSMTQYDHKVTSGYAVNDQQLVSVPGGVELPLKLERERIAALLGYSAEVGSLMLRTYASYDHQTKVGAKADSIRLSKNPLNYAQPVDYTTQGVRAGGRLEGEHWTTGLSYRGALFENGTQGLSDPTRGPLKAYAPDNQLHQVSLDASYRWDSARLKGRFLRGWLTQDETNFVDLTGVPLGITHANGEVQTTQANLRLNSRVGSVRFNARYDYSDRDNRTLVTQYQQPYAIDQFNGRVRTNAPLDITRHRYSLDGVSRLSQGLMLELGYRGQQTERSYGEREKTREDKLYTRVRWSAIDTLDAILKLQFGRRDGSSFQSSDLTSSEANPLLRKYHLADRDRTQATLELSYLPWEALSVDLKLGYAIDDYGDSALGLTESKDSNYHLSLGYRMSKDATVSLFGGQQWLNNEQSGSQSFGQADWFFSSEDRLDYLGGSLIYRGLLVDPMSVGLDYQYSESQSDPGIERGQMTLPYGDYVQWSHSVKAYAVYDWDSRNRIRLDYRYERYFDTDYSEVSSQSIPGLIALEQQGHNYIAHQVMLTYTYAF